MEKLRIVLKMLMMLGGPRRYSKLELCRRFGISERSFYRYIGVLRDAGFFLGVRDGYYYVQENPRPFRYLHDLLHFTEEEASLFYKAIHSLEGNNQLKANLLAKLYKIYDIEEIAHVVLNSEAASNTQILLNAIKNRQQAMLLNYRSANSSKINDRKVEPFDFSTNYVAVWAYEPASASNKLFKTARIGRAAMLPTYWQYQDKHKKQPVDHFRMSGPEFTHIHLRMTLQAFNLMQEDYPLSKEGISKLKDNEYEYQGEVANFKGIGRFVLGLPQDVEVRSPQTLKDYLNKQQKKF